MLPIYKPSGKAAEYGDLAINIYTGCNHRCIYCYAPLQLKRDREIFHSVVEPRKGIVEAVKRQLDKGYIIKTEFEEIELKNKLIHLCFTCDPYPADIDTTPTREIIKLIKESGNHVQILTKGGSRAERDFDLLDENDWFGVTIAGDDNICYKNFEPFASPLYERTISLVLAHDAGIKTWVSHEPIIMPSIVEYTVVEKLGNYIDLFRIGKLNYAGLDPRLKEIHDGIDWYEFGHECERLCKEYGRNYYIKEGLKEIMEGKKP